MAGRLLNAKFLSSDAYEEPVDFPCARMRVRVTRSGIVLQVWSAEMEEAAASTDQIELALSADQAHWLSERLAAVACTSEGWLGPRLSH